MANYNCTKSRTTITAQLVPPGTALVNTYIINIVQRLCSQICLVGADVVTNLNFGVPQIETIDTTTGLYNITIPVLGTITYSPVSSGNCCSRTEMINGTVTVPVTSLTGIASVTIAEGTVQENVLSNGSCGCKTSNLYELQTSILVTAVAAT